jgi:glutathione peroxidase-family protein
LRITWELPENSEKVKPIYSVYRSNSPLNTIQAMRNAKKIIEHKEGKMKKIFKNYYKPTPAKFRKLGDVLLVVGTSITMGTLMEFDKLEKVFTSMENPGVAMNEFCINYGGRGFTEKDGDEKAKTTTIDNLNIDKLDFIKLDIQGFENKALIGGIKTIKNNMPTIFIENYDGRCDEKIKEQERAPIDLLLNLGYKGYRMLVGNNDDCIFTINPEVVALIENKNKVKFEIIK